MVQPRGLLGMWHLQVDRRGEEGERGERRGGALLRERRSPVLPPSRLFQIWVKGGEWHRKDMKLL